MVSIYTIFNQIKSQTEAMCSTDVRTAVQRVQTLNQPRRFDKKNIQCFKCKTFGHFANECRQPTQQNYLGKTRFNPPNCSKCGRTGHASYDCKRPVKRFGNDNSFGYNKRPRFDVKYIDEMGSNDGEEEQEQNLILNVRFQDDNNELIYCELGGRKIQLLIDSGSNNNMIDEVTYEYLKNNNAELRNIRHSSEKKFKAFATSRSLLVRVVFDAIIKITETVIETKATFYVIEGANVSLLGKTTALELRVLSLGIQCARTCMVHNVEKIANEPFPMIKDTIVHISIDPSIKPVVQPLRRAPIALLQQMIEKINELLKLDIIEPVDGPVSWQSPLVPIIKDNGDLRLCVDMRRANEAILKENHPLPTLEDLLPMVKGATRFSRLDVKNAFHQLLLDESAREITTFISPKGVFRYKRLMFGICSAPEIYQKVMERILLPCKGCFNYIDDIVIYGRDEMQHNENLKMVLEVLKEKNVLLNPSKCVFNTTTTKFLGHQLSPEGVRPSDEKVAAIRLFRSPETAEELRSFIGLVTYLGRFIPRLADKTAIFRELVKNGVKFHWSPRHEEAFNKLKGVIGSVETLGYFDPKDEIQLIADASPIALGAVLVQIKDGQPRVISYASKSLSSTEKRYCQTEKEALALVWSVERFRIYLLGPKFQLVTDHRPLEAIFSPKSKPCARIERWVLRLQSFKFRVVYKSGSTNIADPLSRLYTGTDDADFDEDCEQYIRSIVECAALDVDEIKTHTINDEILQKVKSAVYDGDWRGIPPEFSAFRTELSEFDGLILRGTKLVVPETLYKRIIELSHEGHPGETQMKKRLRNRVWFPKMDKMVVEKVKSCRGCILVSAPSRPEPMIRKEMPNHPWEHIALDFLGPLPSAEYLLVVVDYYSRYKEIEILTRITAKETVKRLERIFCRLGFPKSITLDNAKQFISDEFQKYCARNKIKLNHSAPYWPQANGEVERQNRSILKRLKISQSYGREWKDDLHHYLMMYYATPHCSTGKPPGELMYGREIRDKLPSLKQPADSNFDEARDEDKINKFKQKQYVDARRRASDSDIRVGDKVLAMNMLPQNKLATTFNPTEYTVVEKNGARCLIVDKNGKEFVRNSAHLKKIGENTMDIERNEIPQEQFSLTPRESTPSPLQLSPLQSPLGTPSPQISPLGTPSPQIEPTLSSSSPYFQADTSSSHRDQCDGGESNTGQSQGDCDDELLPARLTSNEYLDARPTRSRRVPTKYHDFIMQLRGLEKKGDVVDTE